MLLLCARDVVVAFAVMREVDIWIMAFLGVSSSDENLVHIQDNMVPHLPVVEHRSAALYKENLNGHRSRLNFYGFCPRATVAGER